MTTPPSSDTQSSSSVSSSPKLFKPSGGDIGWRWNSLKDKCNRKRVTCDFCKTETTGGISRAKQHQMGIKGNVVGCKLTPEDVKLLLRENEEKRLAVKDVMSHEASQFHEVDDEASQLQEISRIRSGKRPVEGATLRAAKKNIKGPLDAMFYKKPELTLAKGKQTSMNDAYSKEAREKACQYIARFFYRHGIAFNVARSNSFKDMVEAIGQYGPTLKPPSSDELRDLMLKEELEYTHEMLKSNKEQQAKYGCSIMSDGGTETESRSRPRALEVDEEDEDDEIRSGGSDDDDIDFHDIQTFI